MKAIVGMMAIVPTGISNLIFDLRTNSQMSSKYSEGKSGRGDDRQDIIDIVQEFCMSDAFEQEFEMFAKEHADVFRKSINFSVHSSEHPLEFHDVYNQYLNKFEGMIEDFIVKNGYTIKDFYQRCREIPRE